MNILKRSYIFTAIILILFVNIDTCYDVCATDTIHVSEQEKINTTGSATYLDGSSVLVCIFMDDISTVWLPEEKIRIMKNVDIACDYLKEQGKIYDKEVNLIYDFEKSGGLCYEAVYNQIFPGNCSASDNENVKNLYDYTIDYIHNNIPTSDILERYNVDSIAYLVFINGTSDNAAAYSYYYNYSYNEEEIAFIPIRWTSGNIVNPDAYAHEILHMFGARDLYLTQKHNGISKDFIIYAGEKYPDDIMLGYAADGVSWENKIDSDITKITAYFLGWNEYIYEIEQYPSIEAKYRASFEYKDNPEGNYTDYTLKSKKTDEKNHKADITEKILCVFILIFFIVSSIKNYKKNNDDKFFS